MIKHLLIILLPFTLFAKTSIQWVDWTPDLFEKSQKDNKLVILDLEAVWCHWCHVMDANTYSDPKVIELIQQKFIAVRVDQDLRLDLSRKYEDYGWPATIFFDSKGNEIAKRSGNIPPDEMIPLLKKLIKSPVPEEKDTEKPIVGSESPFLNEVLKKQLFHSYQNRYDKKNAGWGSVNKFLFGETEELALRLAWRGDKDYLKKGKETLTAALALIDPVWGGVYQYSVDAWKEPHFEKIAEAQQKNLILYSLGYSLYQDPKYLKAANDVHRFLSRFLKDPNGAFYTSQDADLVRGVHSEGYFKLKDAARLKKGIPLIDKHQYARENGWISQGLLALYAVNHDESILSEVKAALAWIENERALSGGGFRHDAKDPAGPYLGDTLEMGRAYLKLYQVTGERAWFPKATAALDFIDKNFSHSLNGKKVGYVTSKEGITKQDKSTPFRDENVNLARFANLVSYYSGNKKYRDMAEQAMRYLADPEVATVIPTANVLIADLEFSQSPLHVTILGKKSDPAAQALFATANSYPNSYMRVEWWDKSEGNLFNLDVKYPELPTAAAFVCTSGRCSLPLSKVDKLKEQIDKLTH